MPCRCCASPKKSKGLDFDDEKKINEYLKSAAFFILQRDKDYDGIEEWKQSWIEAFSHHLNGCKEKEHG